MDLLLLFSVLFCVHTETWGTKEFARTRGDGSRPMFAFVYVENWRVFNNFASLFLRSGRSLSFHVARSYLFAHACGQTCKLARRLITEHSLSTLKYGFLNGLPSNDIVFDFYVKSSNTSLQRLVCFEVLAYVYLHVMHLESIDKLIAKHKCWCNVLRNLTVLKRTIFGNSSWI